MYNSIDYTNDFDANKQDIKLSFMKTSFSFTYRQLKPDMSDQNKEKKKKLTCVHARHEARETRAICTYTTLQNSIRRSIPG